MGRLGHGQVVFRAMRVVRGTVFIRGRCDSVIIIILDTMYFVVSQKSLEIQKINKTPGHSVSLSLIVSCVVGGARTCVSSHQCIHNLVLFDARFASSESLDKDTRGFGVTFLRYDEIHCV